MKHRGLIIVIAFSAASALLLWLAPAEQTLGQWAKLIYFHSALSYAGLYAIYASGALGLIYLCGPGGPCGAWSGELGRSALIVWFFAVALSLLAMQAAWGGLFLREPRTIFAVAILGAGAGKEIILSGSAALKLKAGANAVFAAAVLLVMRRLPFVMHPVNPIRGSDSLIIKIYALLLLLAALAALFEFTRWRLARVNLP
jgi:hypothetical protein